MINLRKGYQYITKLPKGQKFLGIISHKKSIFVLSEKSLYRYHRGKLTKIKIKWEVNHG